MSRQSSFSVALAALIVVPLGLNLISSAYILPNLEKATTDQCLNHDWPVDKHQAHMAWCAANGYATD